ncbi:MAG: DUF4097 domain-containing protein [Thermomicrobiales bacterium]|nr:DUF4097 domain-containing protein [Thermomicrobiales bacterium]
MAEIDETRAADHPGSLEGINWIRLDCEHTNISVIADPAMVGQVYLSPGSKSGDPSLVREGDTIIIYQRGRSSNSSPVLTVPTTGCPPINGSLERGDIYLSGIEGAVEIRHGQGNLRVDGGSGDLTYTLGKGDARLANCVGRIAMSVGSGDVQIATSAAVGTLSLGKGDVTCDSIDGRLDLKLGSGDVSIVDSTGSIVAKMGTGDVTVTRPRSQNLTVKIGSGDVVIRAGSLVGMDIETARGDIVCNTQLLPPPSQPHGQPDADDDGLVSRILRSKGLSFAADDKGLRISRGGFDLEAGDAGLRFTKGGFSFHAGDHGVTFSTSDDADTGSFSAETSSGDITLALQSGVPVRVEALLAGGEIQSDVPLVSVGRPGPRGATQRYVGVTDPSSTQRVDLKLRTERGDIRVRLVPTAPQPPQPPVAPSPPLAPTPPSAPNSVVSLSTAPEETTTHVPVLTRDQQMRAILDALSRGEISVADADRMLNALGPSRPAQQED